MKQLFFACLIVIVTTAESKAQCNLIRNGDFSQNTAQLWQPITNSNMSFWTVGGQAGASSDPDLYPNSSIYMYDNNNHNPVDEYIQQQLCTPISFPSSFTFTFKIDASYSVYNQGNLEVVLANGTSEYVIVNTALTSTMNTYTYSNALSSVPTGTYDRIIIRPRANAINNIMSIVVDNVSLTIDKQPYTSTTVTSTCCISPMNLDYTGTYFSDGFITHEWVNLKTSQVIGDQPTISVTPGNGGGRYAFRQIWNYCGTPCVITSDTFLVKCCGGDDDWEFADPNKTTINDPVFHIGKIGVGTNDPQKALDIFGTIPEIRLRDKDSSSPAINLGNSKGFWHFSGPRSYENSPSFHNGKNNLSIWWNAGTWKRCFTVTDDARFLMSNNNSPSVIGNYRLYVNGEAWNTVSWSSSDRNLKNSIQKLENPLDKITKINGYSYYFNDMPDSIMSLPKDRSLGLIAQELLEVIPEAVRKNANGYYAVSYDMVIPLLVEGIKEQQTIIEEQNTKIAELEQAIAEIKAAINGDNAQPQPRLEGQGTSNQMNLHPNPTNGKTNIDYAIKGVFQTAKVEVYNSAGQMLGEYSVNAEGTGNVEIDTTTWAGGTYFCKLIVDNSVQDTKKLVVSK